MFQAIKKAGCHPRVSDVMDEPSIVSYTTVEVIDRIGETLAPE